MTDTIQFPDRPKVGGPRPGAGRPAGGKNPSTIAREQALAFALGPFKGSAREFLQLCMECEKLAPSMRMDAAKKLIEYEESKLSTVTIAEKRTVERETVKQEISGLSTAELAKIVELETSPTGKAVAARRKGRPPVAA